MNLGRLSINQPILAMVLSIVLLIVGALAYTTLPVSEYPQVVPPTVVVTTQYPGASAQTVSDTVAAPIEQEINGVEDMLYLYSQATSNGQLTITVTFKLGTDLDKAQVLVQNRVAIAQPRLPEEVQRNGVTTRKNSPDILMVVFMLSPDDTFDQLYISNYALLQVRDQLLRIDGVGDIQIFGARDYSMRLWLDPDRIANLGLTSAEVLAAIRAQNVQIAGGQIAEPPISDRAFQPNLTFTGRLKDQKQFEDILIKAGSDGRTVRLRDVARIELGALAYSTNSFLLRKSAVAMLVTQRPGSNALATAKNISDTMTKLKETFPKGLDYNIGYNPTEFIAQSVHELIKTIYEAMLLVVIVVLVFLQGWRPAIIPIIAIPVSLVGTFAVMAALGFSINNLTLFGLVLAVGIVVDDAIVVVENVERHLEHGMSRRDAALKTMEEVGGALVSIALVLCAVFVPTAFLGGISGQFFQQFAVTIAVATAISCFCSLTLSPALASLLLVPHEEKRPAGALEPSRTWLERFHRRLQSRVRPSRAWLCRPRQFRDPAFSGDDPNLCRTDRQRRLADRDHVAGLHSGAGSRLRHYLRAIAGRGLAGAHHRGRARDRADLAGYARHRPRRRLRRLLRRHAHAGRQRGGALPGVRRARGADEEGIVCERHHDRAAQAPGRDSGGLHHRDSAAGRARHRHWRRLHHPHPGQARPRAGDARGRDRRTRRRGAQIALAARSDGVLAVLSQHASALRRHRPHQGAEARGADRQH
ncbi:hydrophobe/amphiphile efflux-1 (HAE1) family protein [Bradyrhizobium sp. LM6.11]